MNSLFDQLNPKERRGSKPRCHLLTHGSTEDVGVKLTNLVSPFASIAPTDRWMPQGFDQKDEAELHKAIRLLGDEHCAQIRDWWFAIFRGGRQKGPSFDIASTCTIEGRLGILLVEAKAHDKELINEEGAKPLKKGASDGQITNHRRIGVEINEANKPFSKATKVTWELSRDSRYQMSNRFASACKLVGLGYPVVLVYLGFLNADEMTDLGKPFESAGQWAKLVKSHSEPLFPAAIWDNRWTLNSVPFIPLIRALEIPLTKKTE